MDEELFPLTDSSMGSEQMGQFQELLKALAAPGSVDDLYGTPGGAITQQSLELMLANLTLKPTDMTFWQDIVKIKAFSTVEEYNQLIGSGISDGGFVDAMENPEFSDPDILKQIAIVKFMSEGWKVGDVQEQTRTTVASRALSQKAAMTRLLRNVNRALYSGNSLWIPESIDGLSATISGSSSSQVFDLRGASLTMAALNLAGQLITEGNGNVENSNLYLSPAGVQNLSTIIESTGDATNNRKFVPMGDGNITIGGKISDIMTNYGKIKTRMDKVLGLEYEANGVPKIFNNKTKTWYEGPTSEFAPSAPTIALTNQGTIANSQYSATGTRPSGVKARYRVSARNRYGRSIACALVESTSVVASGGGIDIAITPVSTDTGKRTPSCFVIYGEQVYNSGEFRYLDTIAVDTTNPYAVVTYHEKNSYIPGTARMFIVDQTSAGEDRSLAFAQLAPIHNTDLSKENRSTRGLINLYGTMKYYKPQVLVEIRNIAVTQANINLYNNN
jgi:hypothetical protein